MKKVLVTGSLAYDYIMNFNGRFKEHILPDKVHMLNVSFTAEKMEKQYGGTAGNIAYTLALLGEKPYINGKAGNDFSEYKKWLSDAGVDVGNIDELKDNFTASAHIITDQDDNQITAFHGGAMMCDIDSIKDALKKEEFELGIVSPNCKDGMVKHAEEMAEAKLPFIFDPGQAMPAFSGEELTRMLDLAKITILNDYEAQLLQDKTKLDLQSVLRKCNYVVITLGSKGSEIWYNGKKYEVPVAKPANTSDPTGAGDCFRAGFIKGYLAGMDPITIGKLAAVTSVYTVEKYGTQTHKFTMEEFKKRYKENFEEELDI